MIVYGSQGVQYHPATPSRMQSSPMGTSPFTVGSRPLSSPPNCSDTEEKGAMEAQHDKLPVLQDCPGWGWGWPQRGVTAAVTLPTKATAATKETRVLENIIVKKKIWMRVEF